MNCAVNDRLTITGFRLGPAASAVCAGVEHLNFAWNVVP
jgi:hypothetical protein